MRRTVLSCLAFALAAPLSAQWTSDPAVDTTFSATGTTAFPRALAGLEEGSWLAWFEGSFPDGRDLYLQRLDAQGVEQFPSGGVLAVDRQANSTGRYGFATTVDGGVLLGSAHAYPDYFEKRGGHFPS